MHGTLKIFHCYAHDPLAPPLTKILGVPLNLSLLILAVGPLGNNQSTGISTCDQISDQVNKLVTEYSGKL